MSPRIKKNAARAKASFARCFHSKERQRWVQDGPCLVCGRWPSVNAHIHNAEGSGAGRRGNYDQIIRLCGHPDGIVPSCHDLYDDYKLEIPDARAQAAALEALWLQEALQ